MAGCSAESWARRWAAMARVEGAELGWEEGPLLGCNSGPTKAGCLAAAMAGCSAESWARRWAAMGRSALSWAGRRPLSGGFWRLGGDRCLVARGLRGRVLGCSDGWMLG
eukprot:CCRYP_017774-RA/>CCRYP_017774-RA protein AED:0.49 eAED:1.00 QI:0/-1/0/1/-1/1/1/0/108